MKRSTKERIIARAEQEVQEAKREYELKLQKLAEYAPPPVDPMLHIKKRTLSSLRLRREYGSFMGACIHPNPGHMQIETCERLKRIRRVGLMQMLSPDMYRVICDTQWID